MTQLELAKQGVISPQMKAVAESEGVEVDFIRQGVAQGDIKSLAPVSPGRARHIWVSSILS